jgi:hypothetical protein
MIDFPFKFRNWNEYRAWTDGCLWLSLDRFERFWPDVGLTLSNGAAVKSAVRAALRVEYAINADFRAREAADPDCEDDLYGTVRLEALAKVCFRQINETAGTQDAECVVRWLTGPVLGTVSEYSREHHPWHYTWRSLLGDLGMEDPHVLASSYGIPGDIAQQIVQIAAGYRSEIIPIRERVKAADEEPLSGWDAVAYADYRWECPEPSPLDGLSAHLGFICFERAWAEIIRCTRPADMDALVRWGRACFRSKTPLVDDWQTIIPDDVRAAWSDLHAQPA